PHFGAVSRATCQTASVIQPFAVDCNIEQSKIQNPQSEIDSMIRIYNTLSTQIESCIRTYNALSKKKKPFEPVRPGKVGIYLCGPTVYKESHIGHMVGPVIFDTIKRYLTYSGFEVTWVVNITYVDDKLIGQERERGLPMSQ